MTTALEPSPAPEHTLAQAVIDILALSPAPLQIAELLKKLPKPAKLKKVKGKVAPPVPDRLSEVMEALRDAAREGMAFHHPSGPRGAERYWSRDEKTAVGDAVMQAASALKTLKQLTTASNKAVKGTDSTFIDSTIRNLIDTGSLFEHPAKTKAGGPLFASFPPPPPVSLLEQAKYKKKVDTLFKNFEKLIAEASVLPEDLFAALRLRFSPEGSTPPVLSQPPESSLIRPAEIPILEVLILKIVGEAGPGSVLSLSDVRHMMPHEYQGTAFDKTILRLAEQERVSIYQDSDPAALTMQERAEYVADGYGHVFKTIAKKG